MRASGLLLGLALVAVSKSALGFCRTSTCGAGECTADPTCQFCLTGGKPLFWPRGCVSFSVQQDGTKLRDINSVVAKEHIAQGFTTWISADCGGATPGIQVYDFGFVSCSAQQYNQKDSNANIWVFRDESWPYMSVGSTLALTTLTFNVETGEIFDADVEINSFENPLTAKGQTPEADLLSIVTHEAGHFLGLSHSCVTGATMEPHYQFGDVSLRDLSPDDIAGICEIYPPGENAESCNPEPRHGYSTQCAGAEDKGCCTTAPGAPERHAPWAIGVSVMGAALLAARRRFRGRDSLSSG
jgi:hypothetical protein